MPYVTKDERKLIDSGETPKTAGGLCYQLTQIVLHNPPTHVRELANVAFERYLAAKDQPRWQYYCEVMGAVMGMAGEFKRRNKSAVYGERLKGVADELGLYYNHVIGPYEDGAIRRNGDISELAAP